MLRVDLSPCKVLIAGSYSIIRCVPVGVSYESGLRVDHSGTITLTNVKLRRHIILIHISKINGTQ